MTIIYQAKHPHQCPVTDWDKTLPMDTVVRCYCGAYWLRRNSYNYWVEYWQPVRWWNFAARRRIRESQS